MEETEYLYHYTSIENLALILKNKTIRLNPLDKMDDLQEQKTADVQNLGKFVFVSSWTDDSTESIPMWKMYTNPTSGVRIRLRKNPFTWHGTNGADIEKVLGIPAQDEKTKANHVNTFLDLSKMMDGGYYSVQSWSGDILKQMIYTDDITKLEPRVANVDDGRIQISIGSLGRYKNMHWEFQKEWRYIMTFISMNFKSGMGAIEKSFALSVNKMLLGKEQPPFRFYDLDIDPQYFAEMEITCSPQMTTGNRILVELLVEKFNPSAQIHESELLGKI